MSLKYCLTEDFLLIEITFRILNAKLHNFLRSQSSQVDLLAKSETVDGVRSPGRSRRF